MNNNKTIIFQQKHRKQKRSKSLKIKKKVLCWADSVTAATGFATVARHILAALYQTGLYEIDQLAINYTGEFYDRSEVPYTLVPAKLGNPADPYGNQMFINAVQRKEYDIVLIINDTFVVEEVAKLINDLRDTKAQRKQKPFSLVYYYPVDCRLLPEASTMVKVADRSVAYTNFAKESSLAVNVEPTDVIYHGADIQSFYPLSQSERNAYRKMYLGVENPDTFVFINVNRNSVRKDIARSILAFSEFRKKVTENCIMYIHAKPVDSTGKSMEIDLRVPLKELDLDISKDVIFPNKFNPAKGFPIKVLNQLYNCADAYITTNTGEGYGLTQIDAMCCGVPVIAPNHTSTPEILGSNLPLKQMRGYPILCKELIYSDNSGFRPWCHMEDILSEMKQCYQDWLDDKKGINKKRKQIIKNATQFTQKYSWSKVCKQWIKLFSELDPTKQQKKRVVEGEQV